MRTIKIGSKIVGDGHPILIIAEVGINHNGSLNIAKKLVDLAAESGVDVIKFQKRDLNSLYQKKLIENPNLDSQGLETLMNVLKKVELSEDEYKELFAYCKEKGIIFLCTPWDKKSVDFLEKLGVCAYKISSPDMTNFPLLKYVASKRKPMIVSTGMSHFEEIKLTVDFLNKLKAEFMLMHCNSTYPAAFKDLNLRFINTLKTSFQVPVGYSGHERGLVISATAVTLGANAIERHITLDRTMPGPDHAASVEASGLPRLVKYIRTAEIALGDGKKHFTRGEGLQREILGKSLVAARNIKKGEVITEEMVDAKSPGRGLSPQLISVLIGKKAKRDIKADELFVESDLG